MIFPMSLAGLAALAAGLGVGLLFGFFLERGGLGDARKLTALFYLQDFTVLKVMFTAMVVASGGLLVLGAAGLVELGEIAIPGTYLWPQLAGGLLVGIGFAVGGY